MFYLTSLQISGVPAPNTEGPNFPEPKVRSGLNLKPRVKTEDMMLLCKASGVHRASPNEDAEQRAGGNWCLGFGGFFKVKSGRLDPLGP